MFCWFVPSQCDFITRWVSCCHEHWWIIWFNRFLAVRNSSPVNRHLIQLISMATGVHLPTCSYTHNPPLSARSCGDVPFGCAHLLNMHYSYPQCLAFSPCFLPPPWLGADYDCAWLCWRRSVDVVFNPCHPEGELGAGAGNATAVCVYVNKVCVTYNHPRAAGKEEWSRSFCDVVLQVLMLDLFDQVMWWIFVSASMASYKGLCCHFRGRTTFHRQTFLLD